MEAGAISSRPILEKVVAGVPNHPGSPRKVKEDLTQPEAKHPGPASFFFFFFLIIFILITWYITLIHHNVSHNIRYINYTGLRSIKLLVSDKKKRKDKKKHTKIYYNKNWRRLVNKDDIYCIYSGYRASHNLHHVCNFTRHSFL